jgi:hypothetical protein
VLCTPLLNALANNSILGKYQEDQEHLNEKSLSLLRRKVAKVDNTLVEDIETLIKEGDMVASLGV